MPPPKERSPWKVLLVALLVCTACFVLAAAGLAYWFFSVTGFRSAGGARADTETRTNANSTLPTPGELAPLQPGTNTAWRTERPFSPRPFTPAENTILTLKEKGPLAGDDLFRDVVVPNLEIFISTTAALRLTVNPRTYVSVEIREGDKLYTNVALRLKGGPGSFQTLHRTPSFTVNFDKFAPGQTFHGLKKIHLNSSVQDSTRLNEKIGRELFEAAGVPVPRAGHALVRYNGGAPRLYVVLEGVNKQFLKRYFKDADGDVYDGHSGTDVNNDLPLNSGDEDRTRLRDLARATRERDLDHRLIRLEQTLDLDRFLSFMALEMMLVHWDGYVIGRNNFRVAHDRDSDRMVFLPHGMDQLLGGRRQNLMSPEAQGLVARSVLQIPKARWMYENRVAELVTNVFRVPEISRRVQEIADRVAAALESVDPAQAKAYRERVGPAYCRKIQQRAAELQREVRRSGRTIYTDLERYTGTPLTNWSTKVDVGEAALRRETAPNGDLLLYIGTTNGCTASWRTSALLVQGTYRLEGRIMTKGVALDPDDLRAGAGLRISRHRIGQRNEGDRDWTPVSFEFEVQEDDTEKELVCELRASRGEIWYDLKAFKLTKL